MIAGDLASFFALLVFYHSSEYLLAKYFNPRHTDSSSLLISKEYFLAMTLALVEYSVESYFFPNFKNFRGWEYVALLGFIAALSGDLFRKWAIIHAGPSFTHQIMEEKVPQIHPFRNFDLILIKNE